MKEEGLSERRQSTSKMLHVALYERRISQFSQKYGLHLNKFMGTKSKKRRYKQSPDIRQEMQQSRLDEQISTIEMFTERPKLTTKGVGDIIDV